MKIQFTKRADGSAILKCVRADGTETWQRQRNEHAVFFPLHDLTHYAVETELGFCEGFYGLIARGWDIEETTGQTARGPLPDEAIEVEYLVSAFSAERAGGTVTSSEEFNDHAARFARMKGMGAPRELTDDELKRVRARFDELATKWRGLAMEKALELPFAV
ncbi:MAG: hypothetical protein ACJ8M4_09265 [Chthoniobacterales bacterium]